VLTAATLAYRQLGGRSDGDQGLSESTRRPSARKCDALLPWPGAKRRKDTAPHFETAQDLAARIQTAETVLRAMSLTEGFARLVLIAGHGANVVNNPQASALQCGACGGYSGEVNARLLAALLNDREVRNGLLPRGIAIPGDTLFLAALHDTTNDEVTLYTKDHDTTLHKREIARATTSLMAAGIPGSRCMTASDMFTNRSDCQLASRRRAKRSPKSWRGMKACGRYSKIAGCIYLPSTIGAGWPGGMQVRFNGRPCRMPNTRLDRQDESCRRRGSHALAAIDNRDGDAPPAKASVGFSRGRSVDRKKNPGVPPSSSRFIIDRPVGLCKIFPTRLCIAIEGSDQ